MAFLVQFVLSSKIMITCQKAILVHFQIVRKGALGPFIIKAGPKSHIRRLYDHVINKLFE